MTPRDPRDRAPDEPEDLDAVVRDALARHHPRPQDDSEDEDDTDDGPPPPTRKPWRAGGIGGILLIVVLAAVRGLLQDGGATGGSGASAPAWDTIYARQEVKVRAQAGTDYDVARALNPGDAVQVMRRDHSGWVQVYELDGHSIGFAYRTRSSFDTIPPSTMRQGLLSHPPPAPAAPASGSRAAVRDTTAICTDNTVSFSRNASGTCGGHGGVDCWIHHPGPGRPSKPFCSAEERRRS